MKIYVTDDFDRFMLKSELSDNAILQAAQEILSGLHDGNLDSGQLYKKRIASRGQSKRDSTRSIVVVKRGECLFFIQGWRKVDVPKKGKEIPDALMKVYKLFADGLRRSTQEQLLQSIELGLLREINRDG